MTPPHPAIGRPAAPAAVERALRHVSRLLVSTPGVGFEAVLEVIGVALGTDTVMLAASADSTPGPDAVPPVPTYLLGHALTWARPGSDAEAGAALFLLPHDRPDGRGDGGMLAVPLLVGDERYVGYVGLGPSEYGDLSGPSCDHLLAILGDVLVAHLGRLAHEEARAQTEERWSQLVDRHPDPTLVVVGGALSYANAAAAVLLGAPDPADLVGRPFEDFVSAEDVGRIDTARAAQLVHAAPSPFEHDVIRTDGTVRRVESVSVPFPGAAGAAQTVLRDLTDRRAGEERYRMFVQVTSDGVWRVRVDPPVPRSAAVRGLTDVLVERGRFAELNPAMVQTLGYGRPLPPGLPVGRVLGSAGRRAARSLARALARSNYDLHAHEVSTLATDGSSRHFSVNAIGRFEHDCLAEVWGSCTDITDRVGMERRLVTVLEDQQERIGRDLHDSVGQLLTGVRMLSDGLAARSADGSEAVVARKIADYSAEALDRVRAICRGLVPPQLYSEGAAGAIAELVEHVDALGRTRCVFHHDGAADLLDPDAALQVYRVVQEAVSNALRHAQPETVWVTFAYDGPDVVLEVEDDGSGFDPEASRSRSLGLYGMGRRAGSVGAAFAVESAPGAGTTVRLTFPPVSRRTDGGHGV